MHVDERLGHLRRIRTVGSERLHGPVQELVHDPAAQLLHRLHLLLGEPVAELAHRLLELRRPNRLSLPAQPLNRGHRLQRVPPRLETRLLLSEQLPGLVRGALARLLVRLHQLLQVIHVVADGVGVLSAVGVDVAGHRDIHEATLAVDARRRRGHRGEVILGDDHAGGRRGEDDVVLRGEREELVHERQLDVRLREIRLELLDAPGGSVDDGHLGAPLGHEVLDEETGHGTRADDHHAAPVERVGRELHLHELGGGGGHRDGAARDGRLRSHALPRGDRSLEQAGEVPAEALDVLAQREDVLNLRQDLALAHDHRVEAAGHLEEVRGGILIAEQEEVLAQLVERNARVLAHPLLHLAHAAVPAQRHDVDLHAVASGEDARLLHVGVGGELLHSLFPLILRDGHLLAHLDGARVDREADGHDRRLGLGRVACLGTDGGTVG